MKFANIILKEDISSDSVIEIFGTTKDDIKTVSAQIINSIGQDGTISDLGNLILNIAQDKASEKLQRALLQIMAISIMECFSMLIITRGYQKNEI